MHLLEGPMNAASEIASEKKHSLRALAATNFFLADVQTGLGPFLAAYLAGAGWAPGRVGVLLTTGGILSLILQTPASKRSILIGGSVLLAVGALLLFLTAEPWA